MEEWKDSQETVTVTGIPVRLFGEESAPLETDRTELVRRALGFLGALMKDLDEGKVVILSPQSDDADRPQQIRVDVFNNPGDTLPHRSELIEGGFDFRPQPSFPLGKQIRTRRYAEGLSQAQLANRIGVTQQTIATWEGGGRPDMKHFSSIKGFLGMESEEDVVSIIDAYSSPTTSSPELPPVAQLTELTTKQTLDMLAQTFATLSLTGRLTQVQTDIFKVLIDHYRQTQNANESPQN